MTANIDFKVNNFDLLRLLAATEVIAGHYFQHLNKQLSPWGLSLIDSFPGVPVFFFISGYLISASYERNKNIKEYFRNRILRIFPGLWVCIIVSVIVISFTGVSFFNKQALVWLPAQFAAIIYTPSFLSHYGFGSYNGSLWTIPVELQFYMLVPLCYRLLPGRKINYWLFALLVLFMGLNAWWDSTFTDNLVYKLIRYSFIPNFFMFLIGMIMQRLHLYQQKAIYNKGIYWLLIYAGLYLALYGHINPVIFSLLTKVTLSFCVLSLAYTLPGTAKKLLRNNDISYGVYIYHGLILTIIAQQGLSGNINLFELMLFSYAIAYLSWILVERPSLRMKRKTIRDTSLDAIDKKPVFRFKWDIKKAYRRLLPFPNQSASKSPLAD
jgi:peptidoglycan/LPS O-acetylase OafA/YrhL